MLLYKASIQLFYLFIKIASAFGVQKARLWVDGRKEKFPKIHKEDKIIWLHAASLGEYEQIVPLLEYIKEKSAYKTLVTFYSPSGYEVKKNSKLPDYISYLPKDNKKDVKEFLDYFQPEKAFFVKYDFWWGFFKELHSRKVPVYPIGVRLSNKSYLFNSFGKIFRNLLFTSKYIGTLNQETKDLVKRFGYKNVSKCGDTRFDRAEEVRNSNIDLTKFEGFLKLYDKVIVCGSTWSEDIDMLSPSIKKMDDVGFIIAPHEVNDSSTRSLNKTIENSILFSNIKDFNGERVIIINEIGLLARLYRVAQCAYVGGAFKTGLHNILEPLSYRIPVVFGPKYHKFPEAQECIQQDFAFSVNSSEELEENLQKCLTFESYDSIDKYMKKNEGGTNIIIKNTLSDL